MQTAKDAVDHYNITVGHGARDEIRLHCPWISVSIYRFVEQIWQLYVKTVGRFCRIELL